MRKNDELGYAQRLALAIWSKHYRHDAPDWKVLPDLIGVLTQIDNMTSGLSRVAQRRQDLPPTQEYFLRAMAKNYAGGHCWDHLDGETCVMAADEIALLRSPAQLTLPPIPIEWARPHGETFDQMRANVWASGLAEKGDTILIWVNEGDFWHACTVCGSKEHKESSAVTSTVHSTCTHPRKTGGGHVSDDGSWSQYWRCSDCGAAGSIGSPAVSSTDDCHK